MHGYSPSPRRAVLAGASLVLFLTLLPAAGLHAGEDKKALAHGSAVREKVLESRIGQASFYGKADEGDKTASGEVFDKEEYVAAHPRYPFGTRVRVTNLDNGKSVIVRITDRGPSEQNRKEGVIIDLSWQAAKVLDFVQDGRIRVRLQVLAWGTDKRENSDQSRADDQVRRDKPAPAVGPTQTP